MRKASLKEIRAIGGDRLDVVPFGKITQGDLVVSAHQRHFE